MKVSSAAQIKKFNPDPNAVRATRDAVKDLPPSEAQRALMYHPTKSQPVKTHSGMEGERTGMLHLHPHSTRFVEAHAARGTKVEDAPKW